MAFLTGSRESIKSLTTAIGFGYRYDQDKMEYLHRAGLIGVDPKGRVTQYYHGAYTPPVQLTIGLVKAGNGDFGTLKERIWAGLFLYDASQRKFILNENLVLGVFRGDDSHDGCVDCIGLSAAPSHGSVKARRIGL